MEIKPPAMNNGIQGDRGEQIHMVHRSPLPELVETNWGTVGRSSMRAVLISIDDRGGGLSCWPTIETLATQTGLANSTVRKAVRALADIGVLAIDRKGRSNRYTIVWDSLEAVA